MALFLDSARISDARTAFYLGFLTGITTNPILLSQEEGRPEEMTRRK